MERSKLISIRLDRENEEAIAKLCQKSRYLNRSGVINCLLSAMLFCCRDNGLFTTLNCYDPVSDGIQIYVRADKMRPQV